MFQTMVGTGTGKGLRTRQIEIKQRDRVEKCVICPAFLSRLCCVFFNLFRVLTLKVEIDLNAKLAPKQLAWNTPQGVKWIVD